MSKIKHSQCEWCETYSGILAVASPFPSCPQCGKSLGREDRVKRVEASFEKTLANNNLVRQAMQFGFDEQITLKLAVVMLDDALDKANKRGFEEGSQTGC